jgi:hypothetical protein
MFEQFEQFIKERQFISSVSPRTVERYRESFNSTVPSTASAKRSQAPGGYCRTKPALPVSPSPLVSRRSGASRFLKQARPDLLPRDDMGRVLVVSRDAVISSARCASVRDTASASRLSQTVPSSSAFSAGKGSLSALANRSYAYNLARFSCSGKLTSTRARRSANQLSRSGSALGVLSALA